MFDKIIIRINVKILKSRALFYKLEIAWYEID